MQKTRIEIRANIAIYADACKAAQLAVNNWSNKTIDIADNNRKAKIHFANVKLVKFCIQIKMSLIDSVQETCCKWAINNFIKYSNIHFITSLIVNIGAESANYIEKSLFICHCQMVKHNCPDINDINNINKDIISL